MTTKTLAESTQNRETRRKNANLHKAKIAKDDEFYTMLTDIENEMEAYLEKNADVFRGKTVLCPCDDPTWSMFTVWFVNNFRRVGLKKLICTGYHKGGHGVKYILDGDTNGNGRIDVGDIVAEDMDGDGDFRSAEVSALLPEVDFIITNCPFSLGREFFAWVVESGKKFSFIWTLNCITYKEVFPAIKDGKAWLGKGFKGGNAFFKVGSGKTADDYAKGVFDETTGQVKFRNCIWLTNIDHGRRHENLSLMTMAENKKYSRHKEVKGHDYQQFDNYQALEIPFTDAIPSDYKGVMGVPISFLQVHNPEQFEIVGCSYEYGDCGKHIAGTPWGCEINGEAIYKRLFIKAKPSKKKK